MEGYVNFMVGLCVILPDSSYETFFSGYDQSTSTASIAAVFKGTHTADLEGFPPHTDKAVSANYVYYLRFNEAGKIEHMIKIWNDAHTMAEAGWV